MLNILMLLANYASRSVFALDLNEELGLFFPKSESFKPVQILAHMFMHANFWHLFFNMYALFIFGQVLESVWGPKRFLFYYLVCGLGAALVHESVIALEYNKIMKMISLDQLQLVINDGYAYIREGKYLPSFNERASGIVKYPNCRSLRCSVWDTACFWCSFSKYSVVLLFPPIPIKAKYFVIGYGLIELYLAFSQPGSNVAHAAHLGGMLFGTSL
jgi:membrane associated rhomboid family serine protease